MSSNYPSGYDTFTTHQDNAGERVAAADINKIQDAVAAVQTTLGTNLTTAAARIAVDPAFTGNYIAWAPAPNGSDDTAALTTAIAALPSDHAVLILRPTGASAPYKLPNGLTIAKRISIVGQGGASHEAGITVIECSSGTANALNFTVSGARLRGFQLKNTASSTPSAGAGIKISASRAHLSELTVVGFYVNVDIDGGEWWMTDCYVSSAVKYGLKISRPLAPDSGDMVVDSCYFLGSTYASDAAIRYESAGGLRLLNSKFNWDGSTGGRFAIALDMALTDTTTDLLVSNCSFENSSSHLIHLQQNGAAAATFGNIAISGCQFAAYTSDSTANAIRIDPANGTTPFKTIAITGNTFLGSGGVGTAVYLSNVVNVTVAGGVIRDYATYLQTVSCSNVTDLTGPIADGSVTAVKLASPLGWGKLQSGYAFTFSPHAAGASTLNTGTLRLGPVYIPNTVTLTRIGAEVLTVGDSGSKYRLGIYADNGSCYPGSLVLDAGTIAGDSNTVQEIVIGQVLTPGLYWFGGVTQIVSSTQPTMRIANAPPNLVPWLTLGSSAPTAGLVLVGYAQGSVTGALPSSFSSTVSISTATPRLHIKVA